MIFAAGTIKSSGRSQKKDRARELPWTNARVNEVFIWRAKIIVNIRRQNHLKDYSGRSKNFAEKYLLFVRHASTHHSESPPKLNPLIIKLKFKIFAVLINNGAFSQDEFQSNQFVLCQMSGEKANVGNWVELCEFYHMQDKAKKFSFGVADGVKCFIVIFKAADFNVLNFFQSVGVPLHIKQVSRSQYGNNFSAVLDVDNAIDVFVI